MRKGEFEVLGEQLLDVWAPDICRLLDFNDLKDLGGIALMDGREGV